MSQQAKLANAGRRAIHSPILDPDQMPCSEHEWQEARERLEALLPTTPPGSWKRIRTEFAKRGNLAHFENAVGVTVLVSAAPFGGRWWAHLSARGPNRLPTWEELRGAKLLFLGPHRKAVQIFPKQKDYVNLHPHVLHLWCCLEPEGDGLPGFGQGGTI